MSFILSKQLFVINYNINEDDILFSGIYIDLETAKNELKNIYNKTVDYKYYDYRITVYNLVDKEYKITDKIYTYKFDEFMETNL